MCAYCTGLETGYLLLNRFGGQCQCTNDIECSCVNLYIQFPCGIHEKQTFNDQNCIYNMQTSIVFGYKKFGRWIDAVHTRTSYGENKQVILRAHHSLLSMLYFIGLVPMIMISGHMHSY